MERIKLIFGIFLVLSAFTFTSCTNEPAQIKALLNANVAPPSVTIGTQIWSSTNLDVTTYRDGTPIPEVTSPSEWANLTTGAWCYYNNDPVNGTTYGKLYNWYAVKDPRGLAPVGYHIPTDAEWTTLTKFLGGAVVAGGKMKSTGTSLWQSPNTAATNSSGFTGLPGGYRDLIGTFNSIGRFGNWWSSTENVTFWAWTRYLYSNTSTVANYGDYKEGGFSVRCIKE